MEEIMTATNRTAKPGSKSALRRPPSMPIETQGDASPEYVVSIEVQEGDRSFCENPYLREALLDEAIALTFPASDPVAETPLSRAHAACPDGDELMLDDAIALTFPASDPVAFTPHARTRR
jgi:hypothetical protein